MSVVGAGVSDSSGEEEDEEEGSFQTPTSRQAPAITAAPRAVVSTILGLTTYTQIDIQTLPKQSFLPYSTSLHKTYIQTDRH